MSWHLISRFSVGFEIAAAFLAIVVAIRFKRLPFVLLAIACTVRALVASPFIDLGTILSVGIEIGVNATIALAFGLMAFSDTIQIERSDRVALQR